MCDYTKHVNLNLFTV